MIWMMKFRSREKRLRLFRTPPKGSALWKPAGGRRAASGPYYRWGGPSGQRPQTPLILLRSRHTGGKRSKFFVLLPFKKGNSQAGQKKKPSLKAIKKRKNFFL
jgi:hypothetical protein